MINQILGLATMASVCVGVAPAAMDTFNSAQAQQIQNVLVNDVSTIGRAAIEESLLSDSGDDLPDQLTRVGSRITELPSVGLGNVTQTIRYWHTDAGRVWVETCNTTDAVLTCAIFDNEADQQITVFIDGVQQAEAVAQ